MAAEDRAARDRGSAGRIRLLSLAGLVAIALVATALGQRVWRTPSFDQANPGPPDDDWSLVFADDFQDDSLRPEWTTCYWWAAEGCTNRGNNELQWYLPGQVQLTDGHARLIAAEASTVNEDGERWQYRSGMITTGPRTQEDAAGLAFTYGHVEIRATLPTGAGLWPALWLLPADLESRPEIDLMEMLGDSPTVLRMHVHHLDGEGERASLGQDVEVADLADGPHVFALTWTPDRLRFLLDGREVWSVSEPEAIPDEPMYLLANLAVGGDWPGPPAPDTAFPSTLAIDSVRVWQAPS